MSPKLLIAGFLLLAVAHAHGSDTLVCETSLDSPAKQKSVFDTASGNENTVLFEAGELEGNFGGEPTIDFSGGVLVRRGNRLAGADSAQLRQREKRITLEGNVRYEDPGTQVASDTAEFGEERIHFGDAEFSLGSNNARGGASRVEIRENGRVALDDVKYTTCPSGSEDWVLEAQAININTDNGTGTAQGVRMRFKGVPILFAPFLSFPVSDARKTGILTPEIGSTGQSGTEIVVPFYWNIAPNYDATITPRLLSQRGVQLLTEFRYLSEINEGAFNVDYLPHDSRRSESRHQLRFQHRTLFGNGWRNRINFNEVSDTQYFEDLGGSLSSTSITELDRNLSFDFHSDTLSLFAQFQDYQTIDDAIGPLEEPYRRLPQLSLQGRWPQQFLGLSLGVAAEIVNFDRDQGVTGWRANVSPELSLPIYRPGWFLLPAATLDHTRYELSNTQMGQAQDPTRTVPIGSLDTGLILERSLRGSSRVHTIEPRLLYVHIPHRNQDNLPVFDTITPDLNLVQLFRKNRFVGIDRIGDTDQVSVGITSRILDVDNGKELLTATIGQTHFLSEREVTLPGTTASTTESSDYIAELRVLLYRNLNFDLGHQWGTSGAGATKSQARLQYRPADNKIINLAYRYRRDSLEQGDLSWSWPVGKRWNFVGRYNFSFRDKELLEQFFGLEYESCCWGLRLVTRRYISARDGTRDSSVGLQLVLKGMSSVGTAADKLLENGILGYSSDLR